jgi:hypothetical protein
MRKAISAVNLLLPLVTAGISLAQSSIPGVSTLDYVNLELPRVGSNALHVLSPTLLELKLINTKQSAAARVSQWDWVDSNNQFIAPSASALRVTVDGQVVSITGIGFKRRPLFAPYEVYDLRIENSLYLKLASPVSDHQVVSVTNPGADLWPPNLTFATSAHPLRYSPAIHVNQEGYMPNFAKKAMIGYYLGSLGEMSVPTSNGFQIVDAATGTLRFTGNLVKRSDLGYTYSPTPYQEVYEADFTSFNTPGEYRLVVAGIGGSLPFRIDEGIAMSFARAYQLGLYHQRCGTNTAMPYTRCVHEACHTAPAAVPMPAASFPFTWTTVANYGANIANPPQSAPAITASSQLFPFGNQGALDVSGGHHDAGDYSKYTINSASLVHYLMFAVDSLAQVAALDNLGIPESSDGISDIMQEAKWEADFIAKLQDTDGGFYFLVYPKNREYEAGVTPDRGDAQVVWPKTTSVTAASVAALAQCASSPLFKRTYPAAAALYLQKAQLGWQFLMNAIATYGQQGAYQKITHYGDNFADQDELAWAACEMYLATGDSAIHQKLLSWFDPSNPATMRWSWVRLSECYGHAIRSYAFAVRSGRVSSSQLNPTFFAKSTSEILAAGDQAASWSRMSAYGTSFPEATKQVKAAGWYFSTDQAFDIAVAYQLNPKPEYMTAMLANMNYEGGCNPLNLSYITGIGWKRQRDIVSQWHMVTPYVLPPSGIPYGNVTGQFGPLSTYGNMLAPLCFPSDSAGTAPYPFYDRWGDSWNVTAEMVILNQGRGLGTLAFLAAQTSLKTQPWAAVAGKIRLPNTATELGSAATVSLEAPGIDLTQARITWQAFNQEPTFGSTYTFTPGSAGTNWIEAEALLPDGRRVFAVTNLMVSASSSPNVVWVDDRLPTGAIPGSDGGDSWSWIGNNPPPNSGSLANQSALSIGQHQHFFTGATATLPILPGDVLYAYVNLDPANPPSEIMLQWNDGTWEHRAYWGSNQIGYGTDGTGSRRYMGPLPPAGQWVRLNVPASQVSLEHRTLNGMAFTLYGGRATWDTAGRLSPSAPTTPSPKLSRANQRTTLTWTSVPGKVYQVSYKNSQTDSNWIVAGAIGATGTQTIWVDVTSTNALQRFYLITQMP